MCPQGFRSRLGLPDIRAAEGPAIATLSDGLPAELHYDVPEHRDFHAKFNGYHTWVFQAPDDAPLKHGNHTVRLAFTTRDGSTSLAADYVVPVAGEDFLACYGTAVQPGRPNFYSCEASGRPGKQSPLPGPALLVAGLAVAMAWHRRP